MRWLNVLVCIKRVPDFSGEVLLTEDGAVRRRALRRVHAERPRQLRGRAGRADRVGDRRAGHRAHGRRRRLGRAAPLGAGRRLHGRRPRRGRPGRASDRPTSPARSPRSSVTTRLPGRRRTTWCCWATTPPTPATSRSAIRLAHELDRPVVTGIRPSRVDGRDRALQGDGPEGRETYAVPLPAVVTRDGGRRRAALPDDHRPDEGQEDRGRDPRALAPQPAGSGRVRLTLPPPDPRPSELLGEGPETAGAVVDLLQRLGVAR